jgi:hypothetical protein
MAKNTRISSLEAGSSNAFLRLIAELSETLTALLKDRPSVSRRVELEEESNLLKVSFENTSQWLFRLIAQYFNRAMLLSLSTLLFSFLFAVEGEYFSGFIRPPI